MSKYTVAIIGAGRIAAGFDGPDSKDVLTHAHAFTKNPKTELIGFFDPDAAKAEKEAKRWSTKSFKTFEELTAAKPDIVVIASPDETHASLLQTIAAQKPKVIICEKPVVTRKEEMQAVRVIEVPVIVNYRRRFDETVIALQRELEGEVGRILSVRAIYSKGILHNGSHVLDLARFLFGEMKSGTPLSRISDVEGDQTVGAFVTFERCESFYLTTGDERVFSIFELDILTEKKRFRFTDEGFTLTTETVVPDPVFQGYKALGEARTVKTGLIRAMENLAAHAVEVADGAPSRISLADALKTQEACFRVLARE